MDKSKLKAPWPLIGQMRRVWASDWPEYSEQLRYLSGDDMESALAL